MPPAGRNPQKLKILDFKASVSDRRCLWRVESSTIEGLGFFKALWPTVVAPGGSKSSKNEGLRFVEPLWPTGGRAGGRVGGRTGGQADPQNPGGVCKIV